MSCRRSPASSRAPQFHRALRRDNVQVVQPFMRVGTYPTRDFATLGILLLIRLHPQYRSMKLKGTGPVISADLYMSPHRSDYIFPLVPTGVWHIVSEDSEEFHPDSWTNQTLSSKVFPADCPHRTHCHLLAQIKPAGSAGYSEFPAYSQIL